MVIYIVVYPLSQRTPKPRVKPRKMEVPRKKKEINTKYAITRKLTVGQPVNYTHEKREGKRI